MKKLLTGIVMLSLTSMAFAVPAFSINGGNQIDLTPGVATTVDITVTGGNLVGGLTLNLETDGPFQIEGLSIIQPGMVFGANNTGEFLFTYKLEPAFTHNWAVGLVTTQSGTVAAEGLLGQVTLLVPEGTPEGLKGLITTGSEDMLGESALILASGDLLATGQGSAVLNVIPEPVSALLLLAGLPLIRRRRA